MHAHIYMYMYTLNACSHIHVQLVQWLLIVYNGFFFVGCQLCGYPCVTNFRTMNLNSKEPFNIFTNSPPNRITLLYGIPVANFTVSKGLIYSMTFIGTMDQLMVNSPVITINRMCGCGLTVRSPVPTFWVLNAVHVYLSEQSCWHCSNYDCTVNGRCFGNKTKTT